jgi:hypothetical protein
MNYILVSLVMAMVRHRLPCIVLYRILEISKMLHPELLGTLDQYVLV